MKQYKVEVSKLTELDNYETGCDGKPTDHGVVFKFKSSDLDLVKDRLQQYTNIELAKCEPYETRLEYSTLELDDGSLPNEHQLSLFQKGKIKLWLASYSIYLSEVIKNELNADLLKGVSK